MLNALFLCNRPLFWSLPLKGPTFYYLLLNTKIFHQKNTKAALMVCELLHDINDLSDLLDLRRMLRGLITEIRLKIQCTLTL